MKKSLFEGLIDKSMGVANRIYGFEVKYYFKETPTEVYPILAIFEAEGRVLDTSGDIPIETHKPTLSIRKSDFAKQQLPKKGDSVDINGVVYEVTQIAGDDGWSEMRLVLMKKGKGYA